VIIPCQEDGFFLVPTLKSIFSNVFPVKDFEVLLIRSENECVSERVNGFPIEQYVVASKSQAQALNWGVEAAKGDIICTTKPGCIVSSNWLEAIAVSLRRNPDVDGVGGPVLPCWECGTKIQKLASQIFYEEQGFSNSATITMPGHYQTYLHSTNSAFRKDALKSLEFDVCFTYDYDFDLCWKMLQNNKRLMYNPEMKVQCVFPSSLRNLLRRYYVWGREKAILRKKYSSRSELKSYFYTPYNAVRSFLQPSLRGPTKKLLRLAQHAAYNLGNISGYGYTSEA